jgi:hypothetical protein
MSHATGILIQKMLRGYQGLPGATSENGKTRLLGLLGLRGAPHVACDRKRRGHLGLHGATYGDGGKRKLGYWGYVEPSCRM